MVLLHRTERFVTVSRVVSTALVLLLVVHPAAFSPRFPRLTGRPLLPTTTPLLSNGHRHRSLRASASQGDNVSDDLKVRWQSHFSVKPWPNSAFDEMWENVENKEELGLAFLFVNTAHAADFPELVRHAYSEIWWELRRPLKLVSVLGNGVIGGKFEFDHIGAISLLTGSLPKGATVEILEFVASKDSNYSLVMETLEDRFESCLVFSDPYAPIQDLIMSSSMVLAGGISCPLKPNQTSLAIYDQCLPPHGSMMAIGFGGTLKLQAMVAQGSRPVGDKIYEITECKGDIITKLDDQPALGVLEEVMKAVTPEEQEAIYSGLLLCGLRSSGSSTSMDNDDKPAVLDFLCRRIYGLFKTDSPGIAISGFSIGTVEAAQGDIIGTKKPAPGDFFCFQIRDGIAAKQDLELMVQRAKTARLFDNTLATTGEGGRNRPIAAIQISCCLRGRKMFGVPDVDLSYISKLVQDGESNQTKGFDSQQRLVAGFFANGEIGPIGLSGFSTTKQTDGQSHLHSFTTVAAILCECSGNDGKNRPGDSSMNCLGGGESDEDGFSSMDAWG